MRRARRAKIVALLASTAVTTLAFAGCELVNSLDYLSNGERPPNDAAADQHDALEDASCEGGTDSDPRNCGPCGHDCLGGACVGGVCQPFVLYMGAVHHPQQLILVPGKGQLLWIDFDWNLGDNRVVLTNTSDGTTVVLAKGQPYLGRLATDGVNAYWTSSGDGGPNGAIFSCALTGCSQAPTAVVTGQVQVSDVSVDAERLAWTDRVESAACDAVGKVMTAAPDGSNVMTAATAVYPSFVVTNAGSLYWSTDPCKPPDGGTIAGRVFVLEQGSTKPDTLGTGFIENVHDRALDSDGGQFYFIHGTRVVAEATSPTAQAERKWDTTHQVRLLALDAERGYVSSTWQDDGGATIHNIDALDRTSDGGATTTVLAVGNEAIWGIAADDVAIYYGDYQHGYIYKLVK